MAAWTKLRGNQNARGVVLDSAVIDALRKRVDAGDEETILTAAKLSRNTLTRALGGFTVRAATAERLQAVATE